MSERKEIIHSSRSNGAVPQKDEIIKVTVEWKGIKEELQLSTNGTRKFKRSGKNGV